METPSSGSGGTGASTDERVDADSDAISPGAGDPGRDPAATRRPARCLACGGVCLCILDGDGAVQPYGTADCPDCGRSDFEFITDE